jgi:hypothetical protein
MTIGQFVLAVATVFAVLLIASWTRRKSGSSPGSWRRSPSRSDIRRVAQQHIVDGAPPLFHVGDRSELPPSLEGGNGTDGGDGGD